MKKFFTFLLILLALGLLWVGYNSRPAASAQSVIVAAVDLPVGRVIQASDLTVKTLLPENIPAGAFTNAEDLVGEQVGAARSAGDVITDAHLGMTSLPLFPGERGVGVEVSDSGGLAGVLQAGDRVDVTAVLLRTGNTSNVYSKVVAEGLRVIYVSPEFRALETNPEAQAAAQANSSSAATQRRASRGTINLAVSINATVVSYVFAEAVGHRSITVSLLDLLPALDHSPDVEMSLLLSPQTGQNETIFTSGVYLPNLVVLPEDVPAITPTPILDEIPGP